MSLFLGHGLSLKADTKSVSSAYRIQDQNLTMASQRYGSGHQLFYLSRILSSEEHFCLPFSEIPLTLSNITTTSTPPTPVLPPQPSQGFSSVQSLSCVWLFMTSWTAAHQASLSITDSQSLLNSCLSSWWCHPTISSSAIPCSSCLQSFPASGSFPMSQFFTPGGQSNGASALISALSMNIQDWFPLELNGLISLQSEGLSRVFSNTRVQKHQFFSAQLSL